MLVRSANGSYETIDFREKAPLLANESMYSQNINLSLYGGLAVGVPGELAGSCVCYVADLRILGTSSEIWEVKLEHSFSASHKISFRGIQSTIYLGGS